VLHEVLYQFHHHGRTVQVQKPAQQTTPTSVTTAVFGLALMVWIVVQVLMVGLGAWLQPFYFAAGLVIFLLTLASPIRQYLCQN
jgi:hypothetical protein